MEKIKRKKKWKEKQKPVQGRLPDWMKVERMRGTSYLGRARDAPNRICLSRQPSHLAEYTTAGTNQLFFAALIIVQLVSLFISDPKLGDWEFLLGPAPVNLPQENSYVRLNGCVHAGAGPWHGES